MSPGRRQFRVKGSDPLTRVNNSTNHYSTFANSILTQSRRVSLSLSQSSLCVI